MRGVGQRRRGEEQRDRDVHRVVDSAQGGLSHAAVLPLHGARRRDQGGPRPPRVHDVDGRRRVLAAEPAVHGARRSFDTPREFVHVIESYRVLTDEIARFLPSFLRQKYTPSPSGQFAGQQGYGYRSIEEFVKAAEEINAGTATVKEVCDRDVLATVDRTAREIQRWPWRVGKWLRYSVVLSVRFSLFNRFTLVCPAGAAYRASYFGTG